MLTRPDHLRDSQVAVALSQGWNIQVDELEHQPLGFGSHHWTASVAASRWFVTVDDLENRRRDTSETRPDVSERLTAALSAARSLRLAGLDFVIAPLPTTEGSAIQAIDDRYVAALYPYVEGATYSWGRYETESSRLAVVERIATIHLTSRNMPDVGREDDFVIPSRNHLTSACAELQRGWDTGPFAEPARKLLQENVEGVLAALSRYDRLVSDVSSQPNRRVLTHGEPHRANTITNRDGVVLIDWDTALRASPERDLWMLIDEDPAVVDEYTRHTGSVVDEAALALYRLWWNLCEVALYVAQFRRRHVNDPDTSTAWNSFREHLESLTADDPG